ncbi:MAG: hypothetical protein D3919_10480 [Candidatus Electrothrix sp. AW5]|nr:hypothetical protein [Candidatus Electrothrix gigas]
MHTPVLFLVYKRPDTTRQVFEAIRQAKPPRLYVAADGPKKNVPGEAEKVKQVREIILNGVDWDCEVKTLFREENLGCKYGVSGGIDWFFENEEEGIILEDDTLPSQSFFWFCQELLERYRDDERIFMVSGYNKIGENDIVNDYFFSAIGGIWGWASWRRAWKYYNVDIAQIIDMYGRQFYKLKFLLGKQIYKARIKHVKDLQNGLDTWDFQWSFARHFNSGLSCVPKVSLIENIGWGKDATHTIEKNNFVIAKNIKFPLKKEVVIIPDLNYDKNIHGRKILIKRITNKVKKAIHAITKK